MIGKLNHVAIAVPDLDAAVALYRDTLGAKVSEPDSLPDHGVTVVFVDISNTKIELLEPFGKNSPILSKPATGLRRKAHECSAMVIRKPGPTANRSCSCIPRISPAR